MDYEKKYKEALELARVAAFNGHQSLMEGIFPELKESEDEKIRKDIIFYIKAIANNENISPDSKKECKTWIAWLEKQKPIQNINKEDEEVRQYIIRTMKQKDINVPMVQKAIAWLENIPYTIDHEKREGFHLGYKAGLEKQGEKSQRMVSAEAKEAMYSKPAWSEEDEVMIKVFDSIIRYIVEVVDKDALERFGTNREELFSWLKSLSPQLKQKWSKEDERIYQSIMDDTVQENQLNNKQTNWLRDIKYRYFPQPKHEWSEEDEEMFGYALDMIEWYSGKNEDKSRAVSDWLQSLKPQPKQKWDEEDEKMFKSLKALLNNASCYSCTEGVDKILAWLKQKIGR